MSCARTPERDDNGAGIISVLPPLVPSGGISEMRWRQTDRQSSHSAQLNQPQFDSLQERSHNNSCNYSVWLQWRLKPRITTDEDKETQKLRQFYWSDKHELLLQYARTKKKKSWQIYYSYGFWYYSNKCFCFPKKTNKQKENRYNNSIPHAELVLHPLFS